MTGWKENGRKRHYSEDEEMGEANTDRSLVEKTHQPQQSNQYEWKRNKTGISKKTRLNLRLATMDKEKLLQTLTSLLDRQPDLKHDIMAYIPAPTIPSAMTVLNESEKKLHASFPYNKNGPQRDQYTFSRVRESLLDLIDTITQYSQHFVSNAVFPTTSFAYLDQVTYFVHRLPLWHSDHHNQHRIDLYHDMAMFWKQAIETASDKSSSSSTFNSNTVSLWAKNLAHHNTLANGLFNQVILDFNRCFLPSPSYPNDLTSTMHFNPSVCHPSPALDLIPSPVIGYTDL